MAKTSGTFDFASQNWLFYVAMIFSLFYGFRLFRMAKAKLSPNLQNDDYQEKVKKDEKPSPPEVIPEEEKEEVEEPPKEMAAKEGEEEKEDVDNDVDVDVDVEEKKTK